MHAYAIYRWTNELCKIGTLPPGVAAAAFLRDLAWVRLPVRPLPRGVTWLLAGLCSGPSRHGGTFIAIPLARWMAFSKTRYRDALELLSHHNASLIDFFIAWEPQAA